MRLWCWLNGHVYHIAGSRCLRCHEPAPLNLEAALNALTRLINSYAAILERPEPKGMLEVVPNIPEEVMPLLEQARQNARLRSMLPKQFQEYLDETDREFEEMPE